MSGIFFFLIVPFVLANLPLIFSVVRFKQGFAINDDATGFLGKYRHWRLTHVTGMVLGADTQTTTQTTIGYGPSSEVVSRRTSTSVHDIIRLQTADRAQTEVRLLNYNVSPQPGDVITVGHANNGNKWITLAVLNHTTRRQFINDGDLFKLLEPHQARNLMLSCLVSGPAIVFSAFLLTPFWAVLFALYKRGLKNAKAKFGRSGITPLWQQSQGPAGWLMRSR